MTRNCQVMIMHFQFHILVIAQHQFCCNSRRSYFGIKDEGTNVMFIKRLKGPESSTFGDDLITPS
jgi:hypothetical protein